MDGMTRMEYVGPYTGAVSYVGAEDSRRYQGGKNALDRYADVDPADVEKLEATGHWQVVDLPTTEEPPASESEAQTAAPGDSAPEHWTASVEGLSPQAAKALQEAQVASLADAQAMSDEELTALPGIGEASVQKIRAAKHQPVT